MQARVEVELVHEIQSLDNRYILLHAGTDAR